VPTGLLPDAGETVRVLINFPAAGGPTNAMWTDVTWGTIKLPAVRTWRVLRYTPTAMPRPDAEAGG
jgi:hypothetical protein